VRGEEPGFVLRGLCFVANRPDPDGNLTRIRVCRDRAASAGFSTIAGRDGRMRKPYDWSANVKQLSMPGLLVFGDSDMSRPEHIVSFYQLLGGGLKDAGWMREHMSKNRLAILPDVTHYEMGNSPLLPATVLPFLNG
jgi:pimeloyl-ACP methyl ester carboxylesterase